MIWRLCLSYTRFQDWCAGVCMCALVVWRLLCCQAYHTRLGMVGLAHALRPTVAVTACGCAPESMRGGQWALDIVAVSI